LSNVRVFVWKVLFEPNIGTSVVLLQNEEGEFTLPLWVGESEALSIAMAQENLALERPMTHDLLKTLIESMDASVEWVTINKIENGTFYASIRLNYLEKTVDIDARPSDAIALSLRTDTPIFIKENVLEEALRFDDDRFPDIDNLDDKFLENLPEDYFGKYKM